MMSEATQIAVIVAIPPTLTALAGVLVAIHGLRSHKIHETVSIHIKDFLTNGELDQKLRQILKDELG